MRMNTDGDVYKRQNGARIVYLKSYKELHSFLTQVLQWPDDSNHTLPQMKEHKDFIMMVHSEKGILLAKDICKYISDPLNPMYDAATAAQEMCIRDRHKRDFPVYSTPR